MRNRGIGENPGEYKGEDPHHDQGIEQRPKHAQGHVPVANAKVLQDQVFDEVQIVATPAHVRSAGKRGV